MTAKLLGNEDLLKKLQKKSEHARNEALNEIFDVQVSTNANEQRIILADKNSILPLGKVATRLHGNTIKEIYMTSTTVVEDL